jgi:hypothetical protein
MDSNTTAIIAYCGFIVGLGTTIFTAINHKRCRSSCFGRDMSVSIDVENTTPPKLKLPPLTYQPPV